MSDLGTEFISKSYRSCETVSILASYREQSRPLIGTRTAAVSSHADEREHGRPRRCGPAY